LAPTARRTKEFVRFVEIALREAREANYWLRICVAIQLGPSDRIKELAGEADQLSRILAAIAIKTKSRMRVADAVFAFCILNFALLT
jgi:four helix bundle protein